MKLSLLAFTLLLLEILNAGDITAQEEPVFDLPSMNGDGADDGQNLMDQPMEGDNTDDEDTFFGKPFMEAFNNVFEEAFKGQPTLEGDYTYDEENFMENLGLAVDNNDEETFLGKPFLDKFKNIFEEALKGIPTPGENNNTAGEHSKNNSVQQEKIIKKLDKLLGILLPTGGDTTGETTINTPASGGDNTGETSINTSAADGDSNASEETSTTTSTAGGDNTASGETSMTTTAGGDNIASGETSITTPTVANPAVEKLIGNVLAALGVGGPQTQVPELEVTNAVSGETGGSDSTTKNPMNIKRLLGGFLRRLKKLVKSQHIEKEAKNESEGASTIGERY